MTSCEPSIHPGEMNSHQLNHLVDELIMAEADPDSSDASELVDLKRISAPLFSIPGFFVGFGAKGTHDSDAGRSPTSPLDFGVFANFGGLFSPRSPAPSSPRFSQRNKWVCDKVGLSVLSTMEGDQGGLSDSFRRENVVLAPQIKVNVNRRAELSGEMFDDPCVKSNSLPKNYSAASLSDAVNIHPRPCDSITDVWGTVVVEEHHNSPRRSSSSPMDIISSQAYSRSLSGREMALSEDYTCIISHGPNPKTTHMFGDCILDCDPKELGGLGTNEEIEKLEGDDSVPNFPDNSLSQLCSCTGKSQEDCQNIHIDSEVSAEKEIEETGVEDSLDISPGSSYTEELFPMAMPLNP